MIKTFEDAAESKAMLKAADDGRVTMTTKSIGIEGDAVIAK